MLTRSLLAAAVTVLALSPFAAPEAIAAGAGDLPRETLSPSAPPTTDPMPGVNHDMPGMDGEAMPGMTNEDMPGMDHGSASSAQTGTASGSGGHASGHNHSGAEPAADPRPTAALVGAFVAVNAGVMGSALVLRRRDRASSGSRRTRASRQGQDSEAQ